MMKKFEMWELANINRDTKQAYAIGRTVLIDLPDTALAQKLQFVKKHSTYAAINEVP